MINVVGWDVGAVNVKAVFLGLRDRHAVRRRVASRPFEIWREKNRLPEMLRSVSKSVTLGATPQAMAVTMTAELSDAFTTKREGVLFVLESLKKAFPGTELYVFSLAGEFVPVNQASTRPLDFAASNWVASAAWVAGQNPNCLLIDVGSTTTDLIPIVNGEVRVAGRTDLDRLSSGELVYTGVLRTNLAAIAHTIPVAGRFCRVASEYFAVAGDVHLILGHIGPQDYTCPTPDGRPASVDSARRRLARLVCADPEMLSPEEIDEMARYLCAQQVLQIRDGLNQLVSRTPVVRGLPAILLGSGLFLGEAAAKSAGLEIGEMEYHLGQEECAVAPCVAVAYLLSEKLGRKS